MAHAGASPSCLHTPVAMQHAQWARTRNMNAPPRKHVPCENKLSGPARPLAHFGPYACMWSGVSSVCACLPAWLPGPDPLHSIPFHAQKPWPCLNLPLLLLLRTDPACSPASPCWPGAARRAQSGAPAGAARRVRHAQHAAQPTSWNCGEGTTACAHPPPPPAQKRFSAVRIP